MVALYSESTDWLVSAGPVSPILRLPVDVDDGIHDASGRNPRPFPRAGLHGNIFVGGFIRVDIRFPVGYPGAIAAAPLFEVQRTGIMSMANRTRISEALAEFANMRWARRRRFVIL
ncbi:hypothetical protein SeMB42_g04982 [Synchytrium endobioticum]|uniref:Uncharacterized protein n=1 Tax=Synchytrium endobioticum TaxID=286115 RepID=A0A507CUJ1_9FUNG|nr:hypothetical protein SeMB42_g04982 [Synchytrium endobioticum]